MKKRNTISGNMQELLRVKQVEEGLHIVSFCRKNNLPEEISEALSEDVADMLNNFTNHLHLTAEQIAELVKYEEQEAQSLRPFRHLLNTYLQINVLLNTKGGMHCDVCAEAWYEFKIRQDTDNQEEIEKQKDAAVMERHIWLVSFLRSLNVPEHEILAIIPIGCSEEMAKIIQIVEEDSLFVKILKGEVDLTPELQQLYKKNGLNVTSGIDAFLTKTTRQQIVNTWQTCSEMLSKSITVADIGESGQGINKRPLILALDEEINKKDNPSQDEDSKGVALPSQKYLYQAFNCANIIASLWKPIADGNEKATYKSTLWEITKVLTGNQNPAQYQIEETYAALMFVSTKMFQFTEYVCMKKPTKQRGRPRKTEDIDNPDLPTEVEIVENGEKIRYEAYQVLTNPMTVTLRQRLRDGEKVKGNMEVTLDIHHIITEGRRASQITLPNGKKAFVKKPVRHLTEKSQTHEWKTAPESRFFNTILTCSHKKEKDLMAHVFDYDNRLILAAELDKKAAAKEENTEQTEEGKNKKTALQKEKRNQQNHRARDREELCNMFIRAKEIGLISWYLNKENIVEGKAEIVWKWGRPEGENRKKNKIYGFVGKKS